LNLFPKSIGVDVDADIMVNGNDAASVLDLGGGL
jgi:hypothetical protein